MDHVRSKDINIFFDQQGAVWVAAGTGGISTSAVRGSFGSNWWRLDRGYDYGSLLLVWNDHGQHWQWEPVHDMLLSDYQSLLASSHSFFVRA
jgi:hypothetical protein